MIMLRGVSSPTAEPSPDPARPAAPIGGRALTAVRAMLSSLRVRRVGALGSVLPREPVRSKGPRPGLNPNLHLDLDLSRVGAEVIAHFAEMIASRLGSRAA